MRLLFILFLGTRTCFTCAQFEGIPSVKASALGNTGLINSGVFAASNGIAGILASKEKIALCMSNRFGVLEFTDLHFGLLIGSEQNRLGINYSLSPLHSSLLQSLSLGTAIKLSDIWSLGLAIHYKRLQLESNETIHHGAASVGAIAKLKENLTLYSNLKISKFYQRYFFQSTLGIKYTISYHIHSSIQFSLDKRGHFNWGCGFEIQQDQLMFLLGYQFKGSIISAGIEKTYDRISVSASLQYHPVLYVSPAIQLSHYED